ncbi:MAG: hypothetical protein ACRDOG_07520 [Gaiellaceae bacterium]
MRISSMSFTNGPTAWKKGRNSGLLPKPGTDPLNWLEDRVCAGAHSTWSDGTLPLRELVDLYGRAGFDVLCVTDRALRSDDPWYVEQRARDGRTLVDAGNFDAYVAAIDLEA